MLQHIKNIVQGTKEKTLERVIILNDHGGKCVGQTAYQLIDGQIFQNGYPIDPRALCKEILAYCKTQAIPTKKPSPLEKKMARIRGPIS